MTLEIKCVKGVLRSILVVWNCVEFCNERSMSSDVAIENESSR
jgi:hypothetical protein